jgi:lipopolysaccharide biosynthesis glycosyltransferase
LCSDRNATCSVPDDIKNALIPVVFASDERFVPYLSTLIQSILENSNPSNVYALFVLYGDITDKSAGLIKDQVAVYSNFTIEFINVMDYIRDYTLWTENRQEISRETYFRLLIPYIFTDFEKVIYLDCDMICCTDLAELYDFKIGEYMLISTRDIFGASAYYRSKNKKKRSKRYSIIGIKNHDDYLLAGTLVFNTAKFRETISLKDLLNFAVSRKWPWHDQDILNTLCEGKILFIPIAWGYYDIGNYAHLPEYWQVQYLEAKKNIKIVHFVAGCKPWKNFYMIMHFDLFWKYATRTPFGDVIIDEMKRNGYVSQCDLSSAILENIKHRRGIGLKLLLKGLFAWFRRDKKQSGEPG